MKPKSRSEDKAMQLYSTSKSYIQQLSAENSVAVSRLSELNQSGIAAPGKQVRFRDNIIRRNSHYKRENSRRESRTPSILKRSQQIRNSVLNFVQVLTLIHRIITIRAKEQAIFILKPRIFLTIERQELIEVTKLSADDSSLFYRDFRANTVVNYAKELS